MNSYPKKQGSLLAFSMSGAMALALAACGRSNSSPTMISPPSGFSTNDATAWTGTNGVVPSSPYVYANAGSAAYLGGAGYYPMYGFPGYFYRPAPGSTVQFITGGSPTYSAGSVSEAHANVARGGFGSSGEGSGHSSSHGGGGE
jgi:hypothetical protein